MSLAWNIFTFDKPWIVLDRLVLCEILLDLQLQQAIILDFVSYTGVYGPMEPFFFMGLRSSFWRPSIILWKHRTQDDLVILLRLFPVCTGRRTHRIATIFISTLLFFSTRLGKRTEIYSCSYIMDLLHFWILDTCMACALLHLAVVSCSLDTMTLFHSTLKLSLRYIRTLRFR